MRDFNTVSSRLTGFFTALSLLACGGPTGEAPDADTQPLSSTSKALDRGETPAVEPAPSTQEREAIDLRAAESGGMERSLAAFSYNTSSTHSATVNTADVYFNLSAGETITLGTCGVNGAWGSGDTYLRFYDPSGVQVAFSDDSCGALSQFTYTVPSSGTYLLRAGCFGTSACSGTVGYSIGSALFSYSTSNTNSATLNSADVYLNLSAGQTITLGTCGVSGAWGSGDTYLRLFSPNGAQVAYSDDGCGLLSNFTYAVPVSGTYLLRSGCFGSGACSGTVAYQLQ